MSTSGPKHKRRFGRVVIGVTITFGVAIAACNSIAELSDIKYSPDPLQVPDGALADGEVGDGGTRTVRDSSFEALAQPPPLEFDAAPLGLCEGGISNQDALCDHGAGLGCCIRKTENTSECMHQLEFGKYCLAPAASPVGAMFIACVRSIDGNECCFRRDPLNDNRGYAVYAKSCAELPGAKMMCTETADCPLGEVCNIGATCHSDIKFGFCGAAGGESPVCP